jgi:large repetitive protein
MSSALRRLIAGGCTVVLLIVGVQLLGITAASAHSNSVNGASDCVAQSGTYSVTWTITNDWNDAAETASVTASAPGGATLSSNSVHINKASATTHSATITQSGIPGNATLASLTVKGVWDDNYSQPDSGSAPLGGTCKPTHGAVAPTWKDGACDNFKIVQPTVTIPFDKGVTYKLDGVVKSDSEYPVSAGDHTVTASSDTLNLSGSQTSWDFTVKSVAGDCLTIAQPVAPKLSQSKCDSGHHPTNPTLTLDSTLGITYSVHPAGPYAAGASVTITATTSNGYKFVDADNHGWTYVDASTKTLTIKFDAQPDCVVSALPLLPGLSQSVCNGHDPTNPTLSFKTTEGITYTADPPSGWQAGQLVTVTATLKSDVYKFDADTVGNGWTITGNAATKSFTFDAAPDCRGTASPAGPDVTTSVCDGFTPTNPTLTFRTTTGIDYSADPDSGWTPGSSVTVTATLQHGFKFGDTIGWIVSGSSATKTIKFADAPDCRTETTPVNPNVGQAVCVGNAHFPTDASVTWTDTPQVHYSAPAGPYTTPGTVTITATTQTNYKFAVNAPAGWDRVSDTTETFLASFDPAADCRATVGPIGPSLTQADCPETGTTPIAPTLTLPDDTADLHYTAALVGGGASPVTYAPGDQVTVTALTQSGFKLDANLPLGWDRVSDTEATYAVVFDAGFACGLPGVPSLTQATCPSSGTTPVVPTLTLPSTDGVVYTVDKPGPYTGGEVVLVTATAQAGHQFDKVAPNGWTRFSDSVETFMLKFDATPNCAQTATPSFTNDECASSVPTSASYTIADTTGVDYYVDSVLTVPGTYTATDGSNITVVAKPQSGFTLVGLTSWTHSFPATPDCTDSAKVVKATFTNDQCVQGSPRGATYTVPTSTGVTYTANGKTISAGTHKASAGSTVTVVATAKPGFTLEGTTTWSHAFGATPACHGKDAQHVRKPPAKPTQPLAVTGVPTASLLAVGIGLLLVGGACTFLSAQRRRRTNG